MTFGSLYDSSMDPMEETRLKKKHTQSIENWTKKYHFSRDEVEMLLLIYFKLQKKGDRNGLSLIQFRDFLHQGLNMTDEVIINRLFHVLENGRLQYVQMELWIAIMSLFLRGTLDEHIQYCFAIYDIAGAGFIGKDTMMYFMKNSIIGQTEEESEEASKDLIDLLSKKLDIDRDGKISFNDYRTSVTANPLLLECLGTCLPSRSSVNAFMTSFTKHKLKY